MRFLESLINVIFILLVALVFNVLNLTLNNIKVLFALSLLLTLLAIVRRGIISLTSQFLVAFIALNYFYVLFVIGGVYSIPFDDYILYKLLLVTISIPHIILFATNIPDSKSYRKRECVLLSLNKSKYALYMAMFGLIISASMFVYDAGGMTNLFFRSRIEYKESSTIISLAALYLMCAFSFFYPLYGIMLYKLNKLTNFLFLFLFLVVEYVFFSATFGRTVIILHSLGVIFGSIYLYKNVFFSDNKIIKPSMKVKVLSYILLFFVFIISVFARFYRGSRDVNNVDLYTSLVQTFQSGDLGYFPVIYKAVEYSQYHNIHFYGQSYYRLLLSIIPSSIVSVENTQRIVGSWFSDISVMTIPPGFQGDSLLNFGDYYFVWVLFFGSLLGFLDRFKYRVDYLIFLCTSFAYIFHIARGGFTNPILSLLISFIGVFLFQYYAKIKPNKLGDIVGCEGK